MSISFFVQQLKNINTLSLNEWENCDLHPDLTISPPRSIWKVSCNGQSANQAESLQEAISYFERVLKQHRDAVFKDSECHQLLPKTLFRLKKKCCLLKDGDSLKKHCELIQNWMLTHFPLTPNTSEDQQYIQFAHSFLQGENFIESLKTVSQIDLMIIRQKRTILNVEELMEALEWIKHLRALSPTLSMSYGVTPIFEIILSEMFVKIYQFTAYDITCVEDLKTITLQRVESVEKSLNRFSSFLEEHFRSFFLLIRPLDGEEKLHAILEEAKKLESFYHFFQVSKPSTLGKLFHFFKLKAIDHLIFSLPIFMETNLEALQTLFNLYEEQLGLEEIYAKERFPQTLLAEANQLSFFVTKHLILQESEYIEIAPNWAKALSLFCKDPSAFLEILYHFSYFPKYPLPDCVNAFKKLICFSDYPIAIDFFANRLWDFPEDSFEKLLHHFIQKHEIIVPAILKKVKERASISQNLKSLCVGFIKFFHLAKECPITWCWREACLEAFSFLLPHYFRYSQETLPPCPLSDTEIEQVLCILSPSVIAEIKKPILRFSLFPELTSKGFNALFHQLPTAACLEFFNLKQGSDVKIVVSDTDKSFYIHSTLLKRSSGYFKALFTSRFQEHEKLMNCQMDSHFIHSIEETHFDFLKRYLPSCLSNDYKFGTSTEKLIKDLFIAQFYQMDALVAEMEAQLASTLKGLKPQQAAYKTLQADLLVRSVSWEEKAEGLSPQLKNILFTFMNEHAENNVTIEHPPENPLS